MPLTSLEQGAPGLGEAAGDCVLDPRTCGVSGAAQCDAPRRGVRVLSRVFLMFSTGFRKFNGLLQCALFFIVHWCGLAMQGCTKHAEPLAQETVECSLRQLSSMAAVMSTIRLGMTASPSRLLHFMGPRLPSP